MYYALFEIRSYRQLEKVSAETAADIARIIEARMDGIGIRCETGARGYFLFRFDGHRTADIERLASAVHTAYTGLHQLGGDLMGFAVLVDELDERESTSVFRRLRNTLLAVKNDDSLWIGSGARNGMEHIFELRESENQPALVQNPRNNIDDTTGFPRFSIDTELQESLAGFLNGYYTSTYTPQVYWLQSPHPYELMETLRTAGHSALESAFSDCFVLFELIDSPPFVRLLDIDTQQQQTAGIRSILLNEDQQPIHFAEKPNWTARRRTLNFLESSLTRAEQQCRPLIAVCIAEHPTHTPVRRLIVEIASLLLGNSCGIPIVLSPQEASVLPELPPVRCTPLNHSRLHNPAASIQFWKSTPEGVEGILRNLDTHSLTVLMILQMFHGSLGNTHLGELLQHLGVSPVILPETCRKLANCGLIASETVLVPLLPGLAGISPHPLLAEQRRRIREDTADFLRQRISEGTLAITPALLAAAGTLVDTACLLDWFSSLIQRLLWSRRLSSAQEILRGTNPFTGMRFSREQAHRIRWVLWAYRLQLAVLQQDWREMGRLLQLYTRHQPQLQSQPADRGRILLERARLQQHQKQGSTALSFAKEAVIAYQDAHDRAGIAESNTLIALARLSQGSIWEALDYLQIAQELTIPSEHLLLYSRTSVLLAVVLFLYGNYSRSREIVEQVLPACDASGWVLHALWLRFLRARIAFELGSYSEAQREFLLGRSQARSLAHAASLRIFTNWAARCFVYIGFPEKAANQLQQYEPGPERSLFLGEALMHLGEYTRAYRVLQEAEKEWENAPFTPAVQPDFSHGFALIENLGIGYQKPAAGLLLSRVLAAATLVDINKPSEAVEALRGIIRGNVLTPFDPNAAMYSFLYSQALIREKDSVEDPNAIIGKAAKQLQERSTHIDNAQHKIAYLRSNYWSRRLLSAAQAQKMV